MGLLRKRVNYVRCAGSAGHRSSRTVRCQAWRVDEFGEVVAEGTPSYATVHMALRGAAGFIYVPCTQDGSVHPAILRALRPYYPDYIVKYEAHHRRHGGAATWVAGDSDP
jgi:hypothetical protein